MPTPLACPNCGTSWSLDPTALSMMAACPLCQKETRVHVFPSFFREENPASAVPEAVVIEGEASCFYHPGKRASVPCSSCGRFLCALCDVKLGDRNLCPGCIEAGRTKGKITELEASRVLWDSTALMLSVLPLVLCFWASILTAPAAIVVAIIGWNKPTSVVRRNRWRLWLAVLLGTLEIAGWITFFIFISNNSNA